MHGRFSEELDAFTRQLVDDPIMIALNPNRPTVAEAQAAFRKSQEADRAANPSKC